MKLSLFYNERAGEGITVDGICQLVKRHGHSLVQIVERHNLHMPPIAGDALVAAGGDGTLAAAARLVASGERPLAILPMGTANNIAKSLAVDGPLDGIVERWDKIEPRSIDLGFIGGSWGVHRFIESVGAGLVAEGIAEANSRRQNRSQQKASVQQAVTGYAETLSALTPVRTKIEADGEEIEGEFLVVEVLNMPLIGSNLHFAADVAPDDGLLSIVTIAADQRDALEQYLAARSSDYDTIAPFVSRRAAHVDLSGWDRIHVDDDFRTVEGPTRLSIEVDPGALRVL
jgi:diacylglycerol kinase (ATP)